jgi:hypothetical protein
LLGSTSGDRYWAYLQLNGAMSALGQKRTFALQNGMSAFTPKADIAANITYVCLVPRPGMLFSNPKTLRRDFNCRAIVLYLT